MNVVRHKTARRFLDRAEDLLQRSELENNITLGTGLALAAADEANRTEPADPEVLIVTVESDGQVLGAAIRTPPHKLLITRMPPSALDVLAAHLAQSAEKLSGEELPGEELSGEELPGVVGPSTIAKDFADRWAELTGQAVRLFADHRLYRCDAVVPPDPSPGRFRLATNDDRSLLMRWLEEFRDEIGLAGEDTEQTVRKETQYEQLYLWQDEQPVSMVGCRGKTSHGIRIAPVYTPKPFRRKGYAGNCVAALTRRLLDSGNQYCLLYADAANTTSNGVYQRIGYRAVGENQEWSFE